MKPEELKLINDFVCGTEKWVESMRLSSLFWGNGKKLKPCIYCGCDPEKMSLLAKALEKLLKIK